MSTTNPATINPEYVARLIDAVNTGDFPSHVDFKLRAVDYDSCRVELDIAQKHFQPLGIVHGGVMATMIDTATFWAGFMRLPEDAGLVNVDLKLNYLKAVVGGRLIAEGRCLRPGRQISYTEASVRNEHGELVAHGTSTLMALPGKGMKLGVPKFLD
ncbi:MAG: PaaI family thioesterase [Nevskiales bacterium]|nr:PaaI family thioesterase [Nevskiales bacterium]